MIAIVRIGANIGPTGWIIATDTDDARRQASAAGEHDLARVLYRMSPFNLPTRAEIMPGVWFLRGW